MIRRFDDEKPIDEQGYDVFGKDGSYIGYCDYVDNEWYCDEQDCNYDTAGTYYSDDTDDWLKMIEGLIEKQNDK